MNIKQAKEQIRNAMTAYFAKDAFGDYLIPREEQRPVFLLGAPGIGKTAIMAQIAQELGVGLVSYSMTHHTRQSALGLPFIAKKNYGGKEYSVSEYTMSEIIASVYDLMEETGISEGILFIDEINCVSETLAPSMLQFLQYKVFGSHKVPDGWIVVTAGNPPEYNHSVREFDIATWDRLKVITVEPDYGVWKEYAYQKGVHAAILSYLDLRQSDFYRIETTVDGQNYVTARGWSDLSNMLKVYERRQIRVDEALISQYLRHGTIAKNFAVYYDLWLKYCSDYQISDILAGRADKATKDKAAAARFDERVSLLGLLLDGIFERARAQCREELALTEYMESLRNVRANLKGEDALALVRARENRTDEILAREKRAAGVSPDKQYALRRSQQMLGEIEKQLALRRGEEDSAILEDFEQRKEELQRLVDSAEEALTHTFSFLEDCFGDGQEMVIFVTELTTNIYTSHFIARYGCEKYYRHNRAVLFEERRRELVRDILKLDLDGEP